MERSGARPIKRAVKRQRQKTKPFFSYRTMDFYARGYTAMAKCLGLTHRHFFDLALRAWGEEAERVLGFDVCAASDLSRKEIREIAARVKYVRQATWTGGNKEHN